MARLEPLSPAALTAEQRPLYDAITTGRRATRPGGASGLTYPDGSLMGPFNPWLYAPELGQRAQALGEVARFGLQLPSRLGELGILVVAREWRAQFEWYAHARLAADAGLEPEVIEAIRRFEEPPFSTEDELATYALAVELVGPRHRVPEVLYRRTVDLLGNRQVVELVNLLGYYCLVSAVLNTFEVALPEGVAAPFDEPA